MQILDGGRVGADIGLCVTKYAKIPFLPKICFIKGGVIYYYLAGMLHATGSLNALLIKGSASVHIKVILPTSSLAS